MLLDELESTYKKTKDFEVLNESFQQDELSRKCPNIEHSISNLLKSQTPCVIRWVLYKKNLDLRFEDSLLNLLDHTDAYIHLKTCQILASLYSDIIPSQRFVDWLKSKLQTPHNYDEVNQLLSFVADILPNRKKSLRIENGELFDRNVVKIDFVKDENWLKILKDFLTICETQYFALKIVWILSFNAFCLNIMLEKKIVSHVIRILKEKQREKLTRLSLSIIRHCLEKDVTFSVCTSHKLLNLCSEPLNDEDMENNRQYIKEKLDAFLKKSTCIDTYLNEMFSGCLEESPYHYSEQFWEANSAKLLENKEEILKAIKKYLNSKNPQYICIASNDLYMFTKMSPNISHLIAEYDIKSDLFDLAKNSDNPDIRFHAIQALASCIFLDWRS
ncbi:hypothetical protein EDEG_01272 [Edhazardia aedis USNM 41457]|uniref:ATPase V1 complex subunit H C-terminal domain-containing protein n=1 Tax=Edhazardia aedis (strain USNM 41457) TaxID=1003232 RepID=J9DAG9_EDHAE|nr:hypothetical protein EDEG_01272 [Edhazardia aedis USNM 41457]|eukprot:EJW04504.1 hypothetical protein EDEG_01272 [Edhazardia aedis USNM 41457]